MEMRILVSDGDGGADEVADAPEVGPIDGWVWIDVLAADDDIAELMRFTQRFNLDQIAVRDAIDDFDMPKIDDFGHHLLVVLHGLRDDRVATYEVDCFLTDKHLITIRNAYSPALVALWTQVQKRPELARVGVDELTALLADVLTRRLLSVLEAFDDRVEELTQKALHADTALLEDLTAVRLDLAAVRRVVHPQRETLDVLRHSTSELVSDAGRRRFSDVFDVASRAAQGLDEARSALHETLDAYRGAEARKATEVTKVLTVYAAIMLPLSLVAGIFGMNFANLPLLNKTWGWIVVAAVMSVIAFGSLGVFISLGWVRRPSGRRAGQTLGKGLLEATRAPAQLVGVVFEMSTMPLRKTGSLLSRRGGHSADDHPHPPENRADA